MKKAGKRLGCAGPGVRERFDREARAISALAPHICTLYDVGHENGTAFLVEGETLADRLARGSRPGSGGTSGADTSTS